jgi:hypothetical protein
LDGVAFLAPHRLVQFICKFPLQLQLAVDQLEHAMWVELYVACWLTLLISAVDLRDG